MYTVAGAKDVVLHSGFVSNEEQEQAKEKLRERYKIIERKRAETKLQKIRAGLNARKMSCECCPNENQCTLKGLVWNRKTKAWESNDPVGKPKPMTPLRAWVHTRKLLERMRTGTAPDTVWYKCVICDDKTSSLANIHFGRRQRNNHITKYHRMTVEIFEEICGNRVDWCNRKMVERFKQILMNVHRDDYDDQLTKIRRRSIMERTGIQTARRI